MHLCTQAKRRDAEQFRLSGTKDAAHEIGLGVRERARAGTLQAIEDMVMEVPRKEKAFEIIKQHHHHHHHHHHQQQQQQ